MSSQTPRVPCALGCQPDHVPCQKPLAPEDNDDGEESDYLPADEGDGGLDEGSLKALAQANRPEAVAKKQGEAKETIKLREDDPTPRQEASYKAPQEMAHDSPTFPAFPAPPHFPDPPAHPIPMPIVLEIPHADCGIGNTQEHNHKPSLKLNGRSTPHAKEVQLAEEPRRTEKTQSVGHTAVHYRTRLRRPESSLSRPITKSTINKRCASTEHVSLSRPSSRPTSPAPRCVWTSHLQNGTTPANSISRFLPQQHLHGVPSKSQLSGNKPKAKVKTKARATLHKMPSKNSKQAYISALLSKQIPGSMGIHTSKPNIKSHARNVSNISSYNASVNHMVHHTPREPKVKPKPKDKQKVSPTPNISPKIAPAPESKSESEHELKPELDAVSAPVTNLHPSPMSETLEEQKRAKGHAVSKRRKSAKSGLMGSLVSQQSTKQLQAQDANGGETPRQVVINFENLERIKGRAVLHKCGLKSAVMPVDSLQPSAIGHIFPSSPDKQQPTCLYLEPKSTSK